MIKQNLIITYSNQKARDIKKSLDNPLDKVLTLNTFINEYFERNSLKKTIEPVIASSFIYKTIIKNDIKYFNFLSSTSDTLDLIYDFLLKVNASSVDLSTILEGEKLEAIKTLSNEYSKFKKKFNLVDNNDIVQYAIDNFENIDFSNYQKVFLDSFENGNINFYKSNLELKLLNLLSSKAKILELKIDNKNSAILYKLNKQSFDINEEVQNALKLARKLLEDDNTLCSNEICIVTTDISEYAPIFRLYLKKYDLKGYDSKGIALNLYKGKKSLNQKVLSAFVDIENSLNSIKQSCEKFDIDVDLIKLKEKLLKDSFVLEDKIGIELTEANQLVGLNKEYKHIILMGVDINHFPPKRSDNFLYDSNAAQKYFCENSYYESSLYQYNELKRVTQNLYILYPQYKDKRELSPSIIIDKDIPNVIDISNIYAKKEMIEDEEYLNSIVSSEFTKYDGLDVKVVDVNHLSASQLSSYAKCPLKYLYNYKLGIKTPKDDEEGFDVMQQGSLMHSCFEEFAKKVQGKSDLEIKDFKTFMAEVLEEEYIKFLNDSKNEINEENIYHKIYKYSLAKGLNDDRDDGVLIKFINYYDQNKDDFNYFINSEFEKEFALDIELKPYTIKDKDDKGYFIKGYIDRFDNLQEQINIIDYKSKKADGILQDKLDEIKEFKDFQLGLYTLYATQEYKKDVESYLLTFKTDRNLSTKFARITTNEELIPKYRGKDTGVLYDENYENNLKSNILKIKEKIESGDFRFDSSNEEYCGYCEIRNMCNVSLLNKGEK